MLSAFLLAMGMLYISGKIKIQHYNAVCTLPACCLHAACMLQYLCPTLSIQHYNAVCMLPAHCLHTAVSMPHSQYTVLVCNADGTALPQFELGVTLAASPEFTQGQVQPYVIG